MKHCQLFLELCQEFFFSKVREDDNFIVLMVKWNQNFTLETDGCLTRDWKVLIPYNYRSLSRLKAKTDFKKNIFIFSQSLSCDSMFALLMDI